MILGPVNRLYCALFWIQGKTIILDRKDGANCTVPYFGFKAKHFSGPKQPGRYCTVPYFGFKAKLPSDVGGQACYCTVPYFGFKAKLRCVAGV